jgi:hypothetical protein
LLERWTVVGRVEDLGDDQFVYVLAIYTDPATIPSRQRSTATHKANTELLGPARPINNKLPRASSYDWEVSATVRAPAHGYGLKFEAVVLDSDSCPSCGSLLPSYPTSVPLEPYIFIDRSTVTPKTSSAVMAPANDR